MADWDQFDAVKIADRLRAAITNELPGRRPIGPRQEFDQEAARFRRGASRHRFHFSAGL